MLEKIFKKADDKTIEKRRAICERCPMRKYNDIFSIWTCGTFCIKRTKKTIPLEERSCGCNIKEKTQLKNFHCPQKKW